jgi:hypothetical protein
MTVPAHIRPGVEVRDMTDSELAQSLADEFRPRDSSIAADLANSGAASGIFKLLHIEHAQSLEPRTHTQSLAVEAIRRMASRLLLDVTSQYHGDFDG